MQGQERGSCKQKEGLEDGSVSDEPTTQALGPEFRTLVPMLKPGQEYDHVIPALGFGTRGWRWVDP